jgi:membrane fusion protein, multidrug efflux system
MSEQETLERTSESAYRPAKSNDTPENEPPKSRFWIWAILIVLIVGGVVAYRLYSPSQPAVAGGQGGRGAFGANLTVSVAASQVQRQDVPYYLTGLGSVTAFYTVTLHTRVDGQIMKVFFKEGQFVKEGDELAEIDPRPYQVALDQGQGQLAKDEASQADAKVDLGRYQQLWQEGVIARQQLDSQQATVGQFDGAIQSDKAQIENEKLQLAYSRITSPISGRVGLRLIDPGNIVHAADTNGMLVITQVQPIAVVFTLPEDQLPEVVSEMRNKQLTVEAYSRDDNTKLAEGRLQTIDNQIDQTTGTIRLKAEFDNHDLSLWPNQFVNMRLFLNVRKDARVVPSAAIQKGADGSFVYVVKSDNTAEYRPVQIDFSEGNYTVVKSGLQPGESVVVDGQDKLQQGTKVAVRQGGRQGSENQNPGQSQ